MACIFLTILNELAYILIRIIKTSKNSAHNQFLLSVDLNNKTYITPIKIKNFNITNKEDEENKINITINNIMKELNGKFENEKTINKKKTNKSGKTTKKKIFNESGSYFDFNLFYNNDYKEMTIEEAKYFLTIENYNVNENDYRKNLKELYDKRKGYDKNRVFTLKQNKSELENTILKGNCALKIWHEH